MDLICIAGKQHEQIQIESNATGYSYEKLFSRFLNQFLTEIEVEDPYVRSHHQVHEQLSHFFLWTIKVIAFIVHSQTKSLNVL